MRHYSLFQEKRTWLRFIVTCALFPLTIPGFSFAKGHHRETQTKNEPVYPISSYHTLQWRNVGPFRGGRSTAASGVVSEPLTYYLGTAGGGLWKTADAGLHWKNVTDGLSGPVPLGLLRFLNQIPMSFISVPEKPRQELSIRPTERVCINPLTPGRPGNRLAWKTQHISTGLSSILKIRISYMWRQKALHGKKQPTGGSTEVKTGEKPGKKYYL